MNMNLGKMIAGIGLLIGIYLFVSNSDKTVKIINAIGSNSTKGITVLQGR
jgi:hypothetical protein